MKEKTCFKIPRSTRTDLFSTNSPDIFQNTLTFSTRLADFHKIIITVLNFYFLSWKWSKRITGIIRNSVKFVLFGADLALSLDTAQKRKFYIKNFFFFEQWKPLTDMHQWKIKNIYIRANEAPYVTKALTKAIMTGSELEISYLKKATRKICII